MRIPLVVLCCAALLALMAAPGHAGEGEEQAVEVAEAWLAVVDPGDYGTDGYQVHGRWIVAGRR